MEFHNLAKFDLNPEKGQHQNPNTDNTAHIQQKTNTSHILMFYLHCILDETLFLIVEKWLCWGHLMQPQFNKKKTYCIYTSVLCDITLYNKNSLKWTNKLHNM